MQQMYTQSHKMHSTIFQPHTYNQNNLIIFKAVLSKQHADVQKTSH